MNCLQLLVHKMFAPIAHRYGFVTTARRDADVRWHEAEARWWKNGNDWWQNEFNKLESRINGIEAQSTSGRADLADIIDNRQQ